MLIEHPGSWLLPEIASCAPTSSAETSASEVNGHTINYQRVARLLEALRQRTPREITIAIMGFGGCFTPEMWRAIELLSAERSASDDRKAS